MPRGLHSQEESRRPEQSRPSGEYVRPPPADSGAPHPPDRDSHSGKTRSRWRGRNHRSPPPLHGHARRRETKFHHHDERHARRLPRKQANSRRIPLAGQFAAAINAATKSAPTMRFARITFLVAGIYGL